LAFESNGAEFASGSTVVLNLFNRFRNTQLWKSIFRQPAPVVMTVLIACLLAVPAALEQPANPELTPNPSKAPWYFLGVQELLFHCDFLTARQRNRLRMRKILRPAERTWTECVPWPLASVG
jgi:hypothetical protein